ncbi:hypothetical protein Pcinc_039159 [Petrolisthes cinctipes]|uniref:Uncharacterized protein n=1 Tax=Petrolisthes cinctipes TaxID=88211 RepID=A0AAE1EJS0_PETCI|nr:hypothetical protein Pcinc_039159 [Petrolisthes cinctipes]
MSLICLCVFYALRTANQTGRQTTTHPPHTPAITSTDSQPDRQTNNHSLTSLPFKQQTDNQTETDNHLPTHTPAITTTDMQSDRETDNHSPTSLQAL